MKEKEEQHPYEYINDFCNGNFKKKYQIFDQDFIQDAVLKIFLQFEKSRSKILSINKWLNGSIYKQFCNYHSKKKVHSISIDEFNENDSVEKISDPNQLQHLKHAINDLPFVNNQILTMRLFGGYSYSEISEQLSMNEATIRKNYSRSLKLLKDDLNTKLF